MAQFSLRQDYAKRIHPVTGKPIYYPALRVTFKYKKFRETFGNALVDTGADETMLPLSMANEMGFRFDLEKDKTMWDGAGGTKFAVYESTHPIEFILESPGFRLHKWKANAYFTLEQPTILIGRKNFLDKFVITFDGKNRVFELSTNK